MNYNIIPSYLTIDNPLDPVARLGPSLENNDNRTLPGVSMLGILQGINNALESYPNEDEPSSSIVKQSTLYDVFNITTPRQPTEEMTEWQDAKVLKEAAETSMPALAAQIAYFYLLHPSDETAIINGSMTSQQQRLVVRTLSFGLMEGTFGLLLLLTVAMFFIAPRAVCPRDPTSIGGLAMILAPSTALHHSYQGTASWDFKTLKKATEDQQYQAAISDSTFLLAESIPNSGVDNPPLQKSSSSDQANKIRWWRPLSATIPMQSLVFGLPIGLIIALEVLYQHSQKHHGVADIKSEDSYARYAYAYLPALAMFLVGVLYDSIDLTARLMQPYSLLRKNPQRADRGLFNAQAGKWSPSSLFDSIRLGFPAVAATSVAIIVAKLLSIAVSGLFSPEPSVWGSPISAIRTDDFDFTNYYADVDGTMDGNTLSGMLILNTNLSYPQWTYEDLAFPAIQLQNHGDIANTVTSNSSSSGGSSGRTVQMNLPAVRVQTNCTILDDTNSDILFTAGPNPDTQISLRVHVPNYCDNFNQTWHFSNPSYFGSANEASPAVTAVSRGVQPPIAEQNDCARWITFAGYAHNNSTTNNVNNNNTVSALLCSPYFESVQTTVTFTLPSLTIDPSNPPIIRNENNTKHLASFNNKTQLPEEDDVFVTPSKLTQLEAPYELPYPVDVDQMFSAVAFGRGGTPITELVGPQNIGNLQKAIQHTFGILQAQHVNYQFRIPRTLDATNANDNGGNVLNGTLHNPNRVRMVQSGISTRILEAILAVMLVCALIAFWTMDTWHILPMEPGSIAVVLGLLVAGPGQILSNKIMPQGAQWWSDEKIRKTGVFDGWLFSLGWGKQGDDGDEQQEEKDFGIWARRIH
ncbi:hypothetical protein BDW59DRAFT_149613 [Aspergillus cavernicola]|uniref:Uncharacterized protein n=1 Tax=Aspergillus cavernicola TaxID=176166 RepID=A0ABR4I5L3_9EURO